MILLVSGCGPGQLFGPMLTPTPTATSTPTATPMPTATSTPTATPMPTLTPTPGITMVKGSLAPWGENDVVGNRQIVLCQIIGQVGTTPTDCVLGDKAVTSDTQGAFQSGEISAGQYFILYDTGLSDFQAGLKKWKGKTLELSDIDWITKQYCGSPDGNVTVHFLSGMEISRESMVSLVQALYTCNSPFVLALDPAGSNNAPLIVDVKNGQSSNVEFKVGSFGK
jgi:hypothetical protein